MQIREGAWPTCCHVNLTDYPSLRLTMILRIFYERHLGDLDTTGNGVGKATLSRTKHR